MYTVFSHLFPSLAVLSADSLPRFEESENQTTGRVSERARDARGGLDV